MQFTITTITCVTILAIISFILNTFTITAKVPTSHNIPDSTLARKNEIHSFINSFLVTVLLSNTNNLFVIYANRTEANHDNPLLITSSIPIILANIQYETKLTTVANTPNTK